MRARIYTLCVFLPTPLFWLVRCAAWLFPRTPESDRDLSRRVLGELRRMNAGELDPKDIALVRKMCGEKP